MAGSGCCAAVPDGVIREVDELPVLLIHGGGYDNAAISWARIFGPLSSDRLVIAPDLPGFGYTEGIPVTGRGPRPGRPGDHRRPVVRSQRFVVAGISMGGDIAMHVALRHPEAVAGLVLVAPGGLTERLKNGPTQLVAWLAAQLPDPGSVRPRTVRRSVQRQLPVEDGARPVHHRRGRSGPSSLARPVGPAPGWATAATTRRRSVRAGCATTCCRRRSGSPRRPCSCTARTIPWSTRPARGPRSR